MAIRYTNGVGSSISDMGDLLMQFLLSRQGLKQQKQTHDEDAVARAKELQMEMDQRKAEQGQRSSEFTQTMTANKDALDTNVALAQAPNLPSDTPLSGMDPKVQGILQKYGLIQSKSSLPSTQYGQQGEEPKAVAADSYLFRPANPQEQMAREQLNLSRRGDERAERTANESIRSSGLNTMGDRDKLMLEFQNRLKEIGAQIKGQTDLAGMVRPHEQVLAAWDWLKTTRPNETAPPEEKAAWQRNADALKPFFEKMIPGLKFPGADISSVVPPPETPGGVKPPVDNGPGLFQRFLSGTNNLMGQAASGVKDFTKDAFTMHKCPNGAFPIDGKCRT